ncbi:hypothetical protein BDN67DRAFT_965821 [Paxillus ammoniavirescens]|nr:hypothetical protein BDN67DRAFT_965821 [Paxillus ammoniavirescens]
MALVQPNNTHRSGVTQGKSLVHCVLCLVASAVALFYDYCEFEALLLRQLLTRPSAFGIMHSTWIRERGTLLRFSFGPMMQTVIRRG